nr:hypothetical protein [Tanacetum cinerariifolium]
MFGRPRCHNDVVLDTYFGDNGEDQGLEHQHGESSNAKE